MNCELCREGLCLFRLSGGYGCRFLCYSVMFLPYSTSSGALGSPDFLLSYSVIKVSLHNTIILIITILTSLIFQPYPKSLNQLIQVQIFALLLLLVAASILTSPEDVDPMSVVSALKEVNPIALVQDAISSISSLIRSLGSGSGQSDSGSGSLYV